MIPANSNKWVPSMKTSPSFALQRFPLWLQFWVRALSASIVILLVCVGPAAAESRPNILFCMADDWGWPHAGAYGDQGVRTPNFDRLAREGVLFHHTYVSSPSCTPSRNAVITGKYHWQLGPGANLWSTLPVEHESFIHLLRDNGYVTGRNRPKSWGPGNIKSWAAHHGDHPVTTVYNNFKQFLATTDAGQRPFFFWLATGDPHRPYKKDSGKQSGIDPDKVHLFEHYPDAEVVRHDVADYYFEVERWDQLVGEAIEQLEERNLLDNTIIIMTGDHGMPFPRCKGNLYDSGVRVPFAVRWGKVIQPGREVEDFVSFVDIAPTLLELTGTEIPAEMTGQSFATLLRSKASGVLAPQRRPDIVFGRERHVPAQEKPNMAGYPSRGLRNREFLYIRNYEPERWPAGTGRSGATNFPNQWYGDCDGGPTKDYIFEFREKDDVHRRAFQLCFAKRPAEELYDLRKDPGQVRNVAADPDYRQTLEALRARLSQRLTELHDPRATDPHYDGFDHHPYLGGGGGKRTPAKRRP
jgi:arylsulfatase A-like enzyme